MNTLSVTVVTVVYCAVKLLTLPGTRSAGTLADTMFNAGDGNFLGAENSGRGDGRNQQT